MGKIKASLQEQRFIGNRLRLTCSVKADWGLPDELFFDIVSDQAVAPPAGMNHFALALLVPAMRAGNDLEIEGAVSARLLQSLNGELQVALATFKKSLSRISVSASTILPEMESSRALNRGCATGFSAGVDSFATISLYGFEGSRRIKCLSLFNVGAFGQAGAVGVSEVFEKGGLQLREFAKNVGCEWVLVDSNLDAFYSKGLNFPSTHTIRNASAALLLESMVDEYLYSSAVPYNEIAIKPSPYIATMDPIILPLMEAESLRFRSSGAHLSRFEKTEIVSRNDMSFSWLNVCVAPAADRMSMGRNCSRCWKCNRTLVSLDLIGALEKYDRVFDLEYYRQNKRSAVRSVALRALKGSEIDREIVEHVKRSGYPLPSKAELLVVKTFSRLRRLVEKKLRRAA